MLIYVQSRGKNQDQDYRWLRIKSNESYPENPDFLLQPINTLSVRPIDLIESQKPSIILAARENDYCLLITGLKARKERTDFTGRPVRNSVLWIVRKDSKNLIIRSLLIRALRGELDKNIDTAINISGTYGFEVNYNHLKDFSESSLAIDNHEQIDPSCKIGKNCDSVREEIALELESNALPHKKGLLVLVTSLKSASALKTTGVWRGLSNRVESELKKYSSHITQPDPEKKTSWAGIATSLILIMAIALIMIKLTIAQQPIEQISPKLDKSTQLEGNSGNSWKQESTSTELPSVCQNQPEINYFLSPCSLNVKNN
ncbi:MAG: hypothetical protein AAF383_10350 [Cyanobacteria bacterium P01_A01_bin.83]